ncbi:MAG: hypothetical protein ACOC9H_00050 [Gemmatimonadota bacterium]
MESSLTTVECTLASVEAGSSSVCNTVGHATNQRISIPDRPVDILGTTYTTFPGYSADLFPALAQPNC